MFDADYCTVVRRKERTCRGREEKRVAWENIPVGYLKKAMIR